MSKRVSPVYRHYTRKIEMLARAYVGKGMAPTEAKTKAAAQVRAEIRSLDWLRAYAEEKV